MSGPRGRRPRVLAFTKLIETRAHARCHDARAASRALAASEDLLDRADEQTGDESHRINFYRHSHPSADAAEVYRDLKNPKMALTWNKQAAAMAPGVFTRSVGMRLAIVGTAHLQARDLDRGLELGNRSVDLLARVQSSRAKDCSPPPCCAGRVRDRRGRGDLRLAVGLLVREFNTALSPWRREPSAWEFVQRTRKEPGRVSSRDQSVGFALAAGSAPVGGLSNEWLCFVVGGDGW
ncbi:hypothetical protein ACIHJG_37915 [Streptomyces sp. NPDC052415]|uniref:hypothetical protein n=1 Tax=Streptomyces sp. NPDC052415 TaxID=3365690 RepID=UPI0037D1B115